jgi:hypothetical protein
VKQTLHAKIPQPSTMDYAKRPVSALQDDNDGEEEKEMMTRKSKAGDKAGVRWKLSKRMDALKKQGTAPKQSAVVKISKI